MDEHMDKREDLHAAGDETWIRLSPNHPEKIRDDVAEALRWAMESAKKAGDYSSVAAIAIELNNLR